MITLDILIAKFREAQTAEAIGCALNTVEVLRGLLIEGLGPTERVIYTAVEAAKEDGVLVEDLLMRRELSTSAVGTILILLGRRELVWRVKERLWTRGSRRRWYSWKISRQEARSPVEHGQGFEEGTYAYYAYRVLQTMKRPMTGAEIVAVLPDYRLSEDGVMRALSMKSKATTLL